MDYISDPGLRTNSGAPLLTPWSARDMSDQALAAQQAKDAHAAAISTAVGKAEQTPTFSASASSEDFITSEIQGLQKRLQILQKLFAGNPKGMAEALAQILKELRTALKQYKAATGQDFAAADGAAASVTSPPASSTSSGDASTRGSSASTADTSSPDTTSPDTTSQDPLTKAATVSYSEVDQALREAIGNDGMQFLTTLKGLLKFIDDKMLTPVRLQYATQKHDKDTDTAFKDMDEARKALDQDMSDMQDDIGKDAPALGTRLSTTA